MTIVLARYTTHPDKATANEDLIHAVFDELRRSSPAGLRYSAFKLADGPSFVHLAIIDTADGSNPLVTMDSFKRFQNGLRERCVEPPVVTDLLPVESYGAA